jgi:hypothetical protein
VTLDGGGGRSVGADRRLFASRELWHRLGNALRRTIRLGDGLRRIAHGEGAVDHRASFNLDIAAADLALDPAGRAEMQEPLDFRFLRKKAFDLGVGGGKTSFDRAVGSDKDGASRDIALDGPFDDDSVGCNEVSSEVTLAPTYALFSLRLRFSTDMDLTFKAEATMQRSQ